VNSAKFDRSRATARSGETALLKRNRALIRRWLRECAKEAAARNLLDVDVRAASELVNFPSATTRFLLWAGEENIAQKLGRSRGTVVRIMARMRRLGLLASRRRGMGRTSEHILCINGRPLAELAHAPDNSPGEST
jgi:CRP-like cAMP-binding protein